MSLSVLKYSGHHNDDRNGRYSNARESMMITQRYKQMLWEPIAKTLDLENKGKLEEAAPELSLSFSPISWVPPHPPLASLRA